MRRIASLVVLSLLLQSPISRAQVDQILACLNLKTGV